MSDHNAHAKPNAGPGYETTDVHVAPISKFIVGLVLLMCGGIVAALLIFWTLNMKATEDYANMKPTAMQEKTQVPSGPLLQVTNHDDLLDFRAAQSQKVDGHATWLDKNAKVVRLPLDRALELVSERGLPVFKGETAPAADAATEKK